MALQLARGSCQEIPQGTNLEIDVEWIGRTGVVCDLDVILFTFDTRGQIIDKIDFASPISPCGCISLLADVNVSSKNSSDHEYVAIDLDKLDDDVSAIILAIEGGTKNFQHARSIVVHCLRQPKKSGSSLLKLSKSEESEEERRLFDVSDRGGHYIQTQSICALIFYHTVSSDDVCTCWTAASVMQSITETSTVRKTAKYCDIALNLVPSFEQYRPRTFGSLAAICSSLSSDSLPGLKRIFCKKNNSMNEGLPLLQFIEVIFKEMLSSNYDDLQDINEIRHLVSLLQEMFYQIDVNSDGVVDWEEFTSFCIQMGVLVAPNKGGGKPSRDKQGSDDAPEKNEESSDIVYEDNTGLLTSSLVKSISDSIDQSSHLSETSNNSDGAAIMLNSRHPIRKLKFFKACSRVALIPGDNSRVCMLTRSGEFIKSVFPKSLQHERSMTTARGKRSKSAIKADDQLISLVMDVEYLYGTDSWAFCTSDHVITIAREQFNTRIQSPLVITKRMFSKESMVFLCWCKRSKVLISVDHSGSMYGWDVTTTGPKEPLYLVRTLHTEAISGMVYSPNYDALLTVSLDASIINWDVSSPGRLVARRVISNAHTRGIRTCAYGRNTILTGGFDCIGKTWDIANGNNLLLLQGHLFPIAAAAIMDEKTSSSDFLYAVTADDGGEIRLWNIEAVDSGSASREDDNETKNDKDENQEEAVVYQAQCLKSFNPENAPLPLGRVAHLICPYDSHSSIGPFSNILAVSSKPFLFLPREIRNEFVAPSGCIYNMSAETVITVLGRTLLLCDIGSGGFQRTISLSEFSFDITCLSLDTPRQRRILVGTSVGTVVAINYITGQVLTTADIHKGKEVTSIIMYSVKANDVADYEKSAEENKNQSNKSERSVAKHASMITSGLDGRICVCEDSAGEFIQARSTSDVFRRKTAEPIGNCLFSKKNMVVLCSMAAGVEWSMLKYFTLRRVCGGSAMVSQRQETDILDLAACDDEEFQIIDINLCDYTDQIIVACGIHNPQIILWTYDPKMWTSTITNVLRPFIENIQLSISSISILENEATDSKPAGLQGIICAFDSGHIFLWSQETSVQHQETFVTDDTERQLQSWRSVWWRGHVHTIPAIIAFNTHNSFLTVSFDGYMRMWGTALTSTERNVGCPVAVLGEIPLPNRSIQMRDPRKKPVKAGVWKFLLKKSFASNFSRKLADYLKEKYYIEMLHDKSSDDATQSSERIVEEEDETDDLFGFLSWLDHLSEKEDRTFEDNRLSALCQLQSNDSSRAVLLSNVKKQSPNLTSTYCDISPSAEKKFSEIVGDAILEQNRRRFPNRNKSLRSGSTSRLDDSNNRTVLSDHILHKALSTVEKWKNGEKETSIESAAETMSVYSQKKPPSSRGGDHEAGNRTDSQEASFLDFDDGQSWATTPSFAISLSQWSSMRHNKIDKFPSLVDIKPNEAHNRFLAASAFSVASLKKGCNEGYFGNEELALLSDIGPMKAEICRSKSNSIIALPMKNHVITPIPTLSDAKVGELKLGLQHRLYKNAAKECERQVLVCYWFIKFRSSYFDASSRQKLVALHRISFNANVVRETGTVADKGESHGMQREDKPIDIIYSEPYNPVDSELSEKALWKMTDALKFCDQLQKLDSSKSISSLKKRANANRTSLMDRQANSSVNSDMLNSDKTVVVEPADRFRPYSEDDVLTCIKCIIEVDENLTGDLDFDEWVALCKKLKMTSNSKEYGTVKMNEDDCRTMFFNLDRDGNGRVCLQELTNVLFPLCRRKQMRMISEEFHAELESIKDATKIAKQRLK